MVVPTLAPRAMPGSAAINDRLPEAMRERVPNIHAPLREVPRPYRPPPMTATAAASYDGLRTNEPLVTQLSGTTITSAHSDAVTKARSRVALPVSTIWRAAEERWKGFSLVREGQAQIAPSFSPSLKSRDTHQWLAVNFDLLGRRSVVRLLSFFRREDRPKRRTTAPLQPDRWPHLRRRSDLRPHHGAVRRHAYTLTRCRCTDITLMRSKSSSSWRRPLA